MRIYIISIRGQVSHLPAHRQPPLLILAKLGVPSRQRFCAVPGTWDSAPVSFGDVGFAIPVIFMVPMKCIVGLVTTLHHRSHDFFFGPFEGSISCSSRGLDFFCWSFLGARLFGPSGNSSRYHRDRFRRWPDFHDPFRGSIAWSLRGTITSVAGPYYGHWVDSCRWACLLFVFFPISGLSVLTRAQAHCSCFFRPRCGWRILNFRWRGSRR